MKILMISLLALACSPATMLAQDADSGAAPYCSDLKRIAALAITKERFASIAGKPGDGNFLDTGLALASWKDCSLYGSGTYTCDSQALGTAEAAENAQAKILQEVKSCLGEAWTESEDQSSSSYVVLHSAQHPVSITLSTDQTDKKEHVVRLILFVRRN
jgi:hypothetical protein